MSELRAPDPTLTAMDEGEKVGLCSAGIDQPDIAHRVVWDFSDGAHSACPETYLFRFEYPDNARWFAVPCRECFPQAPEPGHVWSRFVMGRQADITPYEAAVPGLSWQVSP